MRNSFRFKEGLIKDEQAKIQGLIREMLKGGVFSQQSSGMGIIDDNSSRNNG